MVSVEQKNISFHNCFRNITILAVFWLPNNLSHTIFRKKNFLFLLVLGQLNNIKIKIFVQLLYDLYEDITLFKS